LIGSIGLDVDVQRAADELGMTAREAVSVLRDLQPGALYAFGPGLTRTVTRCSTGTVLSTPPKVGDRLAIATPAPSHNVRALVQALGDLPREAEAKARTLDALRAEHTRRTRQRAAVRKSQQSMREAAIQARTGSGVLGRCSASATPGGMMRGQRGRAEWPSARSAPSNAAGWYRQ
jgi:hypothetical protein